MSTKPEEIRWPALNVQQWPIEKLTPYPKNARVHSDEQIEQIVASMKQWGWTMPVLVDESGMIIAGHGRVAAAKRLGVSQVPVVIAQRWSDAQKQAYVIADNKLALNAGWDLDLLQGELTELKGLEFDLDLIGFNAAELNGMFGGPNSPFGEWKGMPEYDQPDIQAHQTVRVHFRNDEDVQAFAKIIGQNLTPDTKFIWYPEEKRFHFEKEYAEAPKP